MGEIETLNDVIIEITKINEEVKNIKENYKKMEEDLKNDINDMKDTFEKSIDNNTKNFNKLIFAVLGGCTGVLVTAMFFIFELMSQLSQISTQITK